MHALAFFLRGSFDPARDAAESVSDALEFSSDKVGHIHIWFDHMPIAKNAPIACSNDEKNMFANSVHKDL